MFLKMSKHNGEPSFHTEFSKMVGTRPLHGKKWDGAPPH